MATSKLSGNTATYNFIIKAKDMKVSDMPTKLILKASVKGSSIFYSNDMQINFEKGADQSVIPEEPSTPDNPTKPEEPSTPEEPQIIVYTIKYDLDGGKLVKSNPQKYDTESDTITLNNPIKEGYTFVGWTGSNGNSPEKTVTIKTGSTGNKEFIANWNKNPADTFTVALIRGTGIATVKGEGAYNSGTKVTVSYTLENGYEFDKWSGDKTEASFTMPAKDVTMTANAKPITYNITYNLEGGTATNPITYTVITDNIILKAPTKIGHTFKGWTGSNGNIPQTTVIINKGSIGNKSYKANWNLNLLLSVNTNSNDILGQDEDCNSLYYVNTSLKITPIVETGVVLKEEIKDNILKSIIIKKRDGSTVNNLEKYWLSNNDLHLSSISFEPNETYFISCESIENVNLAESLSFPFKTFYFRGTGSEGNPYQIETAEQFNRIRNYLDENIYFKQVADIDLSEFNDWIPIGIKDNSDWNFKGNYNGNGNKIKNLMCNTKYNCSMGLFGCNQGTISNLIINNFSFTEESTKYGYVGCISSRNTGKIINCKATNSSIIINANHNDREYVGGISGYNQGFIESCCIEYSNINISNDMGSVWVGGICGSSNRIINSCFLLNTNITGRGNGNVNGNSDSFIGGICGWSSCDLYDLNLVGLNGIISCYVYEDNNHNISKNGNYENLGIIAGSCGKISDCFYNNELSQGIKLIGNQDNNESNLTNCYTEINDYNAFKEKTWTIDNNINSVNNYTWSNKAWVNYNISESNWPPTLKEQ